MNNAEFKKSETFVKLITPMHPLDLAGMPQVFRVTAIERGELASGTVETAILFHEQASLTVRYKSDLSVRPINIGDLVSPRWLNPTTSAGGALNIKYLLPVDRPNADENLFLSVPHEWVRDRNLLREAACLMQALPLPYRHLFNAIFWDGGRFQSFCTAPGALGSSEAADNGTLRHAVEVAGQILKKTGSHRLGFDAVAILAGFLQDAGRFNDAQCCRPPRDGMALSGQYRRITVIEWIAKARVQWHLSIPNDQYSALMRHLVPGQQKPSLREKVDSVA